MILTAPQFFAAERLDLEDINALLESAKTDEQLYTKEFFSAQNYILKGFQVSGIGLQTGTIAMTDATMIMGAGTGDFSYFIAPDGAANMTIAASDLIDGARNYIELELSYVADTPITKAFWDASANGGLGAEFNQEVNTMNDVNVNYVVVSGGFTGLPDRVPLAIIDVNGSGNITVILDRRPLFFREGLPTNIYNNFSWISQLEPSYAIVLSSETGTFVAGETVTFSGGGVTAKVVTGGTSSIAVNLPSGDSFTAGDTCTGGTSGATGTVVSIWESFTGADKDIHCIKDMLLALQTQIQRLQGTPFWYNLINMSISGIGNSLNSLLVAGNSTARFSWSGTNLSITDANYNVVNFVVSSANATEGAIYGNNSFQFTVNTTIVGGTALATTATGVPTASGTLTLISGTGDATITFSSYSIPASGSDVLAEVELLSTSIGVNMQRMDASLNTGTSTIPIGNEQVLFIQLPTSGSMNYSGVGSSAGNYQVVNASAFVQSDQNYWLAYRYNSTLYVRGQSELIAGESSDIGSDVPQTLLNNLGLVDTVTPANYTSNIRGTQGESLVSRLSVLTDAIGDEQDDRSGYIRSDSLVTWDGTNITFTSDLVLEFINTKNGTITQHTVLAADSPLQLTASGQSLYAVINRGATSEDLTLINSSSVAIPAQIQSTKNLFVFFRRVDAGGVAYLHLPFMKQLIGQGQSVRLGQSGSSGQITKVTLYDNSTTTLPTGTSYTGDGVVIANGQSVLFSNLGSGNNEVYQVSGVGTSLVWTAQHVFTNGATTPTQDDQVIIQDGNSFANQVGTWSGSQWLFNNTIRLFNGSNYWELGSMQTASLSDNSTGTIFTVGATGSENIIVHYSTTRNGAKDTAFLFISQNDSTAEVSQFGGKLGSDTGISFSVAITSGNLVLSYTTTSTGNGATMKYFLERWSDTAGGPGGPPSYSVPSGMGGTGAAGSTGDIQYNIGAGVFGADSRLLWDATNGGINLNGALMDALTSSITLLDNQSSPQTILSYTASTYLFATIEYSIARNGSNQVGRLLIVNNGSTVVLDDDNGFTSNPGITFSASLSGGNVLLQYTSTSTGSNATFKCIKRRWS
jgi:hypothetical protein